MWFPRVLGPPLPLAICHLPPLPDRVVERKDKGARAVGPLPPAFPLPLPRAASPGGQDATCGTLESLSFARSQGGRAGGSSATGTQQMG